MPLVFVHGVATRSSREYDAAVAQRNALFRTLAFENENLVIKNPMWGDHAAIFGADLPWLPDPSGNEAFAVGEAQPAITPGDLDPVLNLGNLAGRDAEQAVDLVAMAALDQAIRDTAEAGLPQEVAATGDAMDLAHAAGDYLENRGLLSGDEPGAIAELRTTGNAGFAAALESELAHVDEGSEAFGFGDRIRDALSHLGGMIGNGTSDAVLRAKRRDISRAVALFLGDVFVYLRGRGLGGADGTRERIFAPIIAALVEAHQAPRADGEPLVVVGHSLGGVVLYDILTDGQARAKIEDLIGKPIAIDALFTVGSQPGFFADLGLFAGGRPAPGRCLPQPDGVRAWMNVFDFTDVFSFRCAPMFENVRDFGYDTVTDLFHAHSGYFLRPSFYKRMKARVAEVMA